MKKICTLLAFLCALQGMAQLAPGDIAIIALNPSLPGSGTNQNRQRLVFVALKNIPAGQRITFTDIAWDGASFITTGIPATDGHVTWTAPAGGVSAGEVIILRTGTPDASSGTPLFNSVTPLDEDDNVRGTCDVGKDFFWGNNGVNPTSHLDQVIAYAGTPNNNPATFLWAWSTSNWIYSAGDRAGTSNLPDALNPGGTTLYFMLLGTGGDNAHFANSDALNAKSVLSMAGRVSALQKVFANSNLYRKDDDPFVFPDYSFNVVTADAPTQGAVVESWELNINGNGSKGGTILAKNVGSSFNGSEIRLDNFANNPPQNDDTTGIDIRTSTLGYESIVLGFHLTITSGAANSYGILYSDNNGQNWFRLNLNKNIVSFSNSSITLSPVMEIYDNGGLIKFTVSQTGSSNTGDLYVQISGFPASLNNINNARFRIVTEPDRETALYTGINDIPYNNQEDILFNQVQITANVVLPLTLTNFTATAKTGGVQLDWQTTEEINVKEFQVQKSINGADYTAIATVAAKNQTTNSYNYTDHQPNQGTNYYRLKMVDQDGSFKYSAVKAVQGTSNSSTITVSPTLAQNQITVKYKQLTENTTLVITNLQGQKLLTQPLSKGSNATVIPVSQLAKGSYFVIINDQPGVQFVKQ